MPGSISKAIKSVTACLDGCSDNRVFEVARGNWCPRIGIRNHYLNRY
jgi:hypothetical protein